ncbi:MAG: phenylacetate-CoA oxygenase subunit PaaI [Acidobacteria bacterium]|nr:phenylacetate-CoA oxygenase subunit PaaI [Acidobacteriota bacterium]
MLVKKSRIQTFDDWVDVFHQWRDDIGYPTELIGEDYHFETKLGELETEEIEFGHFASQRKWEKVSEIPDQRIKDSLIHLIDYQGDTEFASVEQQTNLLERAPTRYDLESMIRVNREEMRHGWQMGYLLVTYFGDAGKTRSQRLLQRRASENTRLLGSFNEPVYNWLDFFTYTDFIDRDGKYQLNMLSRSAFAPLARSMRPMLQEEAFHLLTGNTGLMRIVKAGRIPSTVVQKYFNKWISTAYDLFGQDESSTAYWSYLWGVKGRYDEHLFDGPPDMNQLNDVSRNQYYKEVSAIVDSLNRNIKPDQPKLKMPDIKFHRSIGMYAGKTYSVSGELLSNDDYEKHLKEVMPSEADVQFVINLEKEKGWIIDPQQTSAPAR